MRKKKVSETSSYVAIEVHYTSERDITDTFVWMLRRRKFETGTYVKSTERLKKDLVHSNRENISLRPSNHSMRACEARRGASLISYAEPVPGRFDYSKRF